MQNLTDGKTNGVMISYVKDETVYPVLLTKEQSEVLDFYLSLLPGKLRVVTDKPQGASYQLT